MELSSEKSHESFLALVQHEFRFRRRRCAPMGEEPVPRFGGRRNRLAPRFHPFLETSNSREIQDRQVSHRVLFAITGSMHHKSCVSYSSPRDYPRSLRNSLHNSSTKERDFLTNYFVLPLISRKSSSVLLKKENKSSWERGLITILKLELHISTCPRSATQYHVLCAIVYQLSCCRER